MSKIELLEMRKFISLMLIAVCLELPLQGLILKAPDLMQFAYEIHRLGSGDLVLFDMDETLIIPSDRILQPNGREIAQKIIAEVFNRCESAALRKYPLHYLQSQILKQMRYRLVDPWMISLIDNLRARRVNMIAFTSAKIGPLYEISSLADWRIEKLRQIGVAFDLSLSDYTCLSLPTAEYAGHCPLYKNGVLFTDQLTKGPVLCAFFNTIHWIPATLFMIDSELKALESVEEMLQKTEIRFVGFHYTAVADCPETVDERVAEFQYRYLTQQGIWLSEALAQRKIDESSRMASLFSITSSKSFATTRQSN